MKFISLTTDVDRQQLLDMLRDNEKTNRNVRFDEKRGKPHIHVKEDGDKIKMKCEYIGGPSKDNGFIGGTAFRGKITEKNGKTKISGIITTSFIFHLLLLTFMVIFVIQCIIYQGFSVVPPIILVFDIFMFYPEFKKQGIIERYIKRAIHRAENENFRQYQK